MHWRYGYFSTDDATFSRSRRLAGDVYATLGCADPGMTVEPISGAPWRTHRAQIHELCRQVSAAATPAHAPRRVLAPPDARASPGARRFDLPGIRSRRQPPRGGGPLVTRRVAQDCRS